MAKPRAKDTVDPSKISYKMEMGQVHFHVLGVSPLLINRMSEKAKRELLIPRGPLSKTERKANLKHNPLEEFRASVYRDSSQEGRTRLAALSVWFKKGIASMALDVTTGTNRTQLGRCVFVTGERMALYGKPLVHMDIVRMANMDRTPDVRTRCILPQWACKITVQFMKPALTEKQVTELAIGAGMFRGCGENRPEKGSGTFGQYTFVDPKDPRLLAVLKQGRAVQDEILHADPLEQKHFYDEEAFELYSFWQSEVVRREMDTDSKEELAASNGHAEESDVLDTADV